MSYTFHSNGKLLITGEYVVLDGAKALAIPTKLGQSMVARASGSNAIQWTSLDEQGNCWFEETFSTQDLRPVTGPGQEHIPEDNPLSKTLSNILRKAKELNPSFWQSNQHWNITTKLDFPRDWGLGSSSTLINNIAQWAHVDAFILLNESFGGSGYDIAAAQNDTPIIYQRNQNNPKVKPVSLPWNFKEQLYFVHLNEKQDSKEGIRRYKSAKALRTISLDPFSEITEKIVGCTQLSVFESLLEEHEALLSAYLDIPTVKTRLFPDYPGMVKSLGAWGGDFVLATGTSETPSYFKEKGYHTVLSFSEMTP
ncbi:MAG: GYDIA family GHMP kinase [Bacteroidota bacterium]